MSSSERSDLLAWRKTAAHEIQVRTYGEDSHPICTHQAYLSQQQRESYAKQELAHYRELVEASHAPASDRVYACDGILVHADDQVRLNG